MVYGKLYNLELENMLFGTFVPIKRNFGKGHIKLGPSNISNMQYLLNTVQ